MTKFIPRRVIWLILFALLSVGLVESARAESFKDCATCPEMISLESGSFDMGNPTDPNDMPPWPGEMKYQYRWEQPAHTVHIAKPFALGKTEVTRGQFALYVAATGQEPKNGCLGRLKGEIGFHEDLSWQGLDFEQTDDHPAVCINRAEAEAYMAWLSQLTGHRYRFPSEAEWEFAARAGTTTEFPWGNDVGQGRANCKTCGTPYDDQGTSPVASFDPNPWGFFDMAGNVWEPTLDCSLEGYVDAPNDGSAWDDEQCSRRVIRGGSWYDVGQTMRSALRGQGSPKNRIGDLGFRVARDIEIER